MDAYLLKLIPALKRRIHAYHEMFDLALKAELWEEVLSRSSKEIGCPTTWEPTFSHKIGEDMQIPSLGSTNNRISCKSGVIQYNKGLNKPCVKFNGSRSTSFKTLPEKIAHFSKSHDDWYFLLSKKSRFDKTYTLLVFPSSTCCVDSLEWSETASKKAWIGTGKFSANIGKSMSSQLWTTLPLDMIPMKFDIDCRESVMAQSV